MPDEQQRQLTRLSLPFTPYDFFGYLVPGLVFFASVLLFESLSRDALLTCSVIHVPILSAFETIMSGLKAGLTLGYSLLALGVLLTITYVAGHVVASVSALVFDRALIAQRGYPFKHIFKGASFAPKNEHSRNKESMLFYRYFFVHERWAIVIVATIAIVGLSRVFWGFWGIVILVLSMFVVAPVCAILVHKWLNAIFSSSKHFPESLSEDFFERFKTEIKVTLPQDESLYSNMYWLATCYVHDKSPRFADMLNNWLHLYSFSRNTLMAFYLAHMYIGASVVLQRAFSFMQADMRVNLLFLFAAYFLLSLMMALRFYYVYYFYYSKFLARAFVYLTREKVPKCR